MSRISGFDPRLVAMLPETHAILESANLTVHPRVLRVTLHGSRGLAGGYRPVSDIDLSLIVDVVPDTSNLETVLNDVLQVTLWTWRSNIEPDLAAIFDIRKCGLTCFDRTAWDEHLCSIGGVDCFGLFKIQKGFNGFVTNAGVRVKRMYPCLRIWRRK